MKIIISHISKDWKASVVYKGVLIHGLFDSVEQALIWAYSVASIK